MTSARQPTPAPSTEQGLRVCGFWVSRLLGLFRPLKKHQRGNLFLALSPLERALPLHPLCSSQTLCGRQGTSYESHFANGKPEAQKARWFVQGHTRTRYSRVLLPLGLIPRRRENVEPLALSRGSGGFQRLGLRMGLRRKAERARTQVWTLKTRFLEGA